MSVRESNQLGYSVSRELNPALQGLADQILGISPLQKTDFAIEGLSHQLAPDRLWIKGTRSSQNIGEAGDSLDQAVQVAGDFRAEFTAFDTVFDQFVFVHEKSQTATRTICVDCLDETRERWKGSLLLDERSERLRPWNCFLNLGPDGVQEFLVVVGDHTLHVEKNRGVLSPQAAPHDLVEDGCFARPPLPGQHHNASSGL